jgi:hypothetical protein
MYAHLCPDCAASATRDGIKNELMPAKDADLLVRCLDGQLKDPLEQYLQV